MKSLSIVIALILTLGLATQAPAASYASSNQQQQTSSSSKNDYYKGWVDLNSSH